MPAPTTSGVHRGWLHVIWVVLCVAAVTNGATFWLKRIGWLEPGAYQDYLAEKSRFRVTSRLDPAYTEAQTFQWQAINRLYAVTGTQTITKLVKFGVVLLVIGVSLWTAWRTGHRPAAWTQPVFLVFAALVLFAALVSWLRFDSLLLLPGVRSFAFLVVALSATWLASTRSLALLSKYLILLMFLQLVLIREWYRRHRLGVGVGIIALPVGGWLHIDPGEWVPAPGTGSGDIGVRPDDVVCSTLADRTPRRVYVAVWACSVD
jgi:hypothetical protein